jgi:hypothetical protein
MRLSSVCGLLGDRAKQRVLFIISSSVWGVKVADWMPAWVGVQQYQTPDHYITAF